jgi:hypothetical protein
MKFFKNSTFVIINRAIGALGLIVLPFVILHQWLTYAWCDKSFFIYKFPVFNTLLEQSILTMSDLCLIELACILSFLFRVFYLSAARDGIVDTQLARMRKMKIEPKKAYMKIVLVGILFFSIMFNALFVPPDFINSYGAMKVAALFISVIFAFFYAIPEIILCLWLVLFGKLDVR